MPNSEPKSLPLNIRIKSQQRSLVEQAASVLNKSVSDFVREVIIREASHILLDRSHFIVDAERWEMFTVALDAPPAENPRLDDLMKRKPRWQS